MAAIVSEIVHLVSGARTVHRLKNCTGLASLQSQASYLCRSLLLRYVGLIEIQTIGSRQRFLGSWLDHLTLVFNYSSYSSVIGRSHGLQPSGSRNSRDRVFGHESLL